VQLADVSEKEESQSGHEYRQRMNDPRNIDEMEAPEVGQAKLKQE
jgi:hypothetical protein